MAGRLSVVALGLALAASSGCRTVGALVHRPQTIQAPALPAFANVEVTGPVNADIAVGGQPAVTLEGKKEDVHYRVEKGTLFVEAKETGGDPVRVRVAVPELRRLRAAGATVNVNAGAAPELDILARDGSSVKVNALDGRRLVVEAVHHSRVTLAGTAESAAFSLADASRGDGRQLKVRAAKVTLAGASRLDLRPEQTVSGEASGGSRLEVWSKPRRLKVATRAEGSVEYVR